MSHPWLFTAHSINRRLCIPCCNHLPFRKCAYFTATNYPFERCAYFTATNYPFERCAYLAATNCLFERSAYLAATNCLFGKSVGYYSITKLSAFVELKKLGGGGIIGQLTPHFLYLLFLGIQ